MPKFNKNNIKELKDILYNSYGHDAKLENVKYESGEDSIKIELFNPIFGVKTDLTFHKIRVALMVKGEWFGNHETVLSLTVEEDFSCLQKYLSTCIGYVEDSLYLLFQMFSGDEVHIVSKEVTVEIT